MKSAEFSVPERLDLEFKKFFRKQELVCILKVKNRIDALTSAKTNTDTNLNPFLSAFLHVIYFQYTINQRNAHIAELAA